MKTLVLLLLSALTIPAADQITYWIEECHPGMSCVAGDLDLARWAFAAWQRESGGGLVMTETPLEAKARFKLHWVSGNQNLYGETRPYMMGGKRGANIYVLPATYATADSLLRDAIVYLTCVHETGHALGLEHTNEFADIMYTFANGGDINAYFGRYRDLLKTRQDIAKHAGVSDADRIALRALYK
ncbi:MAG: matrixin family metalloprotease [Terriglobia bacterium]